MDMKQQLFERLDQNMADYHELVMGFDKETVFNMAVRISVVTEVYGYLKNNYHFRSDADIAYLLKFRNPLEIVSDSWELRRQDLADINLSMWSIFEHRDSEKTYPLMTDAPAQKEKPKKPSLLDTVKANKREVKPRSVSDETIKPKNEQERG